MGVFSMRNVVVLAVCFVATLTASQVEAQVCAGSPSFASGPIQVGIGSQFTGNAQQFGAQVGFGAAQETGPIGSLSVGLTNVSDLDATATSFGGQLGFELAGDEDSRVFLCPSLGVSYLTGPDIGEVNTSAFEWGVGGQVGLLAADAGIIGVVPTVGLRIARVRATAEFLGVEETMSDTYGAAHVGVGLVFNKSMSLTPAVSIPFGLEGGDAAFMISFAANFGR
jgi:hypothetical protein